jgi:hypothetical protein
MAHADYDHDTEVVHIEHRERSRWRGWVAGFILALVVIAVAIAIYFAVSDDDDDGTVEVPGVDVSVENPSDDQ